MKHYVSLDRRNLAQAHHDLSKALEMEPGNGVYLAAQSNLNVNLQR